MAIVFVAVYRGTGSQLRHQIDTEITGDEAELTHDLSVSGARTPRALASAATRYIASQPFSASSTLLFVIVAHAGISTNRPEVFGASAPDDDESAAEQRQENLLSAHLLGAGEGFSTELLADVGDLRVLKRHVGLHGLSATVGVGEPLSPVARAQSGVAEAFLPAGLLALAAALIASYLVSSRVSRPLRRIAAVAARVDAGDLHPRIHGEGVRDEEIRVLVDAFNHMLDRLTEAFAGQRAFIADASHELRTPLTVIRGQLEVLAAQDGASRDEVRRVEGLVQAEVARMSRLVDDLLLLTKTEQTELLRSEPVDVRSFVDDLWDGVSLLARRRFELGQVPSGTLLADPDRLAQALRNLLGNAIEHTAPESGLVRLRVQEQPSALLRFTVEDDGPGIPAQERELVFQRFHRTDAARDRASGGTGLGLAIVQAIVLAHHGRVWAGESPEGGALVAMELPGFTATEPISRAAPIAAGAHRGRRDAE